MRPPRKRCSKLRDGRGDGAHRRGICSALRTPMTSARGCRRRRIYGRNAVCATPAGRCGPSYPSRISAIRRLADKSPVEDLGRVRIVASSRTIEGGEVRRKVLALLCLLLSRSRFASTREEVVESLWPDLAPSAALNSLNQTVYFGVFEPGAVDDTASLGYGSGQDGRDSLVDPTDDGRSRRCLEIIRSTPGQAAPEAALALANEYRGRFALDFAYEEWSGPYRDSLHAGYLRVMEHAIRTDLDVGISGAGPTSPSGPSRWIRTLRRFRLPSFGCIGFREPTQLLQSSTDTTPRRCGTWASNRPRSTTSDADVRGG